MAKRIERDGKFYRIRRGKEVEIPDQWVGKTVHPQERRSRKSRRTRQQRDAEAPTDDEELRRAADGRSITPITDEQLDALYFADLHNLDMDDEGGAIAFCDCENCAE
jgi:hypothetical protein